MPDAGAGAGDHRVVVDVEDVRIYLGPGIAAGQLGSVPPVGGAAAAVEQAGLAEDEGAAADAEHPGAAIHRAAQRLEEVIGKRGRQGRVGRRGLRDVQAQAGVADSGEGDQVRLGQPVQAVGGWMVKSMCARSGAGSPATMAKS